MGGGHDKNDGEPGGTEGNSNKRRTRRAYDVEEIFSSVSTVQASDLTAPPARVTLTPRSAEACLKHGINPEMLRIRDLDSFWEPGIDPAVQRMRHEAYSQRRHEMMRLCRVERKRLINIEMRAQEEAQGIGGPVPTVSAAGRIFAEQQKMNVAAIEMEKRRLAKMKLKQQKEIEQVVSFEQRMAELQAEVNKRLEQEKLKQEATIRAREKRMKQTAELRRIKELKKKAQEDAEEERRREVAREMFEKDQEVLREKAEAERRAKREALQREEERLRKAEEHRLITQKIIAEQQEQVKKKMDEMEDVERKRIAKVEAKQRADRRRLRERRRQIEMRLEANLEMAKRMEEKRKQEFFTKQGQHEALRRDFLEEQARQQELFAHQQELLERKRQLILKQFKEEEEEHKQHLLKKFEEDEQHVRRVSQARRREHMLQRERKHLKQVLKLENVERVKRIKEYKRLEVLKKIHDADERTNYMVQQKQDIIAQRKKTAVRTKIARDALMRLVEKAKTCTGDKAVRVLQKAVKAEILSSGDDAELPSDADGSQFTAGDGRKKRAKSASNVEGSSSARGLPTLPGQSASARREPLGSDLGAPPEAPGLAKRLQNAWQNNEAPPEAYVSPYDATYQAANNRQNNQLPLTVTF